MRKILSWLLCVVCLSVAGVGGRGSVAGQQRPYHEPPLTRAESLVEVLVDGVPREVYYARGRSYVEALRGAEYALRVRNPFGVRVAVALSVDGLNTIDARRTSRWDSTKWVIEPYQTITISGWQVSRERARRFYFTNERDAYASKLGRPSDLGFISAVFYRERGTSGRVVTPPPYPEPRPMERERRGGNADSMSRSEQGAAASPAPGRSARPIPPDDEYAATGIGRSVHHDVVWTHLDLDPRPAAEVSLRYEYRDALVRLGVLPRPYYPSPDPLRRRERATGFEGERYSPEP